MFYIVFTSAVVLTGWNRFHVVCILLLFPLIKLNLVYTLEVPDQQHASPQYSLQLHNIEFELWKRNNQCFLSIRISYVILLLRLGTIRHGHVRCC